MKFQTASATVQYGQGQGRIILELEPGVLASAYPIRVFPADVGRVTASVGSVSQLGILDLVLTYEPVAFSGTDTVSPRYPITGGFTAKPIGSIFTPDGDEVSPTLTYDPESGDIRAPYAIVGAYTVDYTTRYLRMLYKPTAIARDSLALGAVFAFKDGAVGKLDIDLRAAESDDFAELYSVVSNAVVQGDSAISDTWEVPPGWPDTSTYPEVPGESGPDPEASIIVERVHERAMTNKLGQTFIRRNFVAPSKPFVSWPGYRPEYRLERGSSPGEEWSKAFVDAPWGQIIAAVQKRWPGIDVGDA